MNLKAERELRLPVEEVRAALRDRSRWPAWVPGLVQVTPVPRGEGRSEVELVLRGPRTLRARLEVTTTEEGLGYNLLEGDAATLGGSLRAEAESDGARVVWELEIVFPLAIPGALMAELGAALPRWLAELERALVAPEAAR